MQGLQLKLSNFLHFGIVISHFVKIYNWSFAVSCTFNSKFFTLSSFTI